MSIEAIKWALNDAPDVPPSLVATLLGLANHTGPDGRNAYPKLATLARYTRKAERSVQRDIDALKDLGLVEDGIPGVVEHLPGGQRPAVYDLVMDRRRDPKRTEKTGVRRGGKRGGTPDVHVTPTPDVDVTPTPDVHVRGEPVPTPDVHVRSTPDVHVRPPLTSTSRARLRNEPSTEPTDRTNTPSLRSGGARSTDDEAAGDPDLNKIDTVAERRKPARRGTRLPADWKPAGDLAAWTLSQGLTRAQAYREFEKFHDYWNSAPGAKGVKRDWPSTWRNWIRKAVDDKSRGARPRPISAAERTDQIIADAEARLDETAPPQHPGFFPFIADVIEGETA